VIYNAARKDERMSIQSIKTRYQNVMFRSKTEAKWAMLFDLVGWEWKYEAEGFSIDQDSGPREYAPDFYFPKLDMYLEVKSKDLSSIDMVKIEMLSRETGSRCVLACGEPGPTRIGLRFDHGGKGSISLLGGHFMFDYLKESGKTGLPVVRLCNLQFSSLMQKFDIRPIRFDMPGYSDVVGLSFGLISDDWKRYAKYYINNGMEAPNSYQMNGPYAEFYLYHGFIPGFFDFNTFYPEHLYISMIYRLIREEDFKERETASSLGAVWPEKRVDLIRRCILLTSEIDRKDQSEEWIRELVESSELKSLGISSNEFYRGVIERILKDESYDDLIASALVNRKIDWAKKFLESIREANDYNRDIYKHISLYDGSLSCRKWYLNMNARTWIEMMEYAGSLGEETLRVFTQIANDMRITITK
jgi:hypothetical protein